MRLHFLNDRERQGTREFYESAFPEDSKEFVDFYYDWIVKQNDIFAAGQWEGNAYKIQAMMHINRHNFLINGFHRSAPYLVAVATRPECRKQGKMRCMMEQALQDLCRRQYPFAFLMPANPAYYTSLGFRYFPTQPGLWKSNAQPGSWKPNAQPGLWKSNAQPAVKLPDIQHSLLQGISWRQPRPQDIPQMCAFANQILGQSYQIAIQWEKAYCKRLFAETAAEQGGVLLLESSDTLQGILVYGISTENIENKEKKTAEIKDLILDGRLILGLQGQKEGVAAGVVKRHIQESLCHIALPEYAIAFPPMEMMLRILCISAFVPLLKNPACQTLYVDIEDPVISSNCGCFELILSPDGNRINRTQRTGNEQKMDIAELAQFLLKDIPVYITEWV